MSASKKKKKKLFYKTLSNCDLKGKKKKKDNSFIITWGTQGSSLVGSSNHFKAHLTSSSCKWQTHLAWSSTDRAAAVSFWGLSQVVRQLRLQRSHRGSRQLADKATHSIMDDKNSWLCMYDNWCLLYPLHQRRTGHCGSQRLRL